METDALAKALQSLAEATAENTKLLKEIAWWWINNEQKKSYDEIKKKSTLEKIAYYTVQKLEKIGRRDVYSNAKTFKSKVDAENYLAHTLKNKWRIVIKMQYLSTKQPDYEEQKRADNGESLDIQGTQNIPESSN